MWHWHQPKVVPVANEFRGYQCWTTQNVNDTVVVDAVNSSPAVFLATHRPTPLIRRDFSGDVGRLRSSTKSSCSANSLGLALACCSRQSSAKQEPASRT